MIFLKIDENNTERYVTDIIENGGLVKFYRDNCIHCENMKAAWNALEFYAKFNKKINKNKYSKLVIAEVNADALPTLIHKLPNNKHLRNINGFPTILYINPGGKVGGEFNDDRTTENLAKFIDSNLKKHHHTKTRLTKKRNTKYGRIKKKPNKSRRKQRTKRRLIR